MMREEFEKRTGIFVTSRLYEEIERRYMELDIDKDTFCKNYKANKDGLAESIQMYADMEEAKENSEREKELESLKKELADTKESCKKRVDDLQKKLDKELEWKPCDGGTNYEQDRYEKLAGSVGTKELQEHEAKNLIYEEFGFAPEKVKIISEVSTYEANKYHQMRIVERYKRKALYNATDWNYVRFDCAGWQYEMVNGSLRNYES